MENSKYGLQFGWEGDNGLGDRLINQVLQGEKTATCAPEFGYKEDELKQVFAAKGTIVPLVDKNEVQRGMVKMDDVFRTTFGNPDPRLVSGECCGNDVKKFQDGHRNAWKNWLLEINRELNNDTVLIVECFRLCR